MSMPNRVKALISVAGRLTTYKRFTSDAEVGDALTVVNTYTDYADVPVFVTNYSAKEITAQVHEGDRKAYLAAKAVTFRPNNRDRLQVGGNIYEIISVDNLAAKNEESIYRLQIRGLNVNG